MELHHLRHFVAVAEELHFGRAAKRLRMAQPPLSQSIRRLEGSLGLALLERSRRHVALTPAGRVLLDEARRIVAQVELAQRLAKRAATSGVNRLRVGFTPLAIYSVVPRAVTAFRARWPGVQVMLEERSTRAQIEELLNGHLDVGVFLHVGEPIAGLAMRPIARWGFVAAIPSAWPLAKRSTLRLADLATLPWVMHDPAPNPAVHAAIRSACRKAGFEPQVAQHANQAYTMLSLVASEIGVTLSSTSRQMPRVDGVSYVPVLDLPPDLYVYTVLACAARAASPEIASFVASVEELAKAASA
jgi:DNA-binding transcriptional LysR family regulator